MFRGDTPLNLDAKGRMAIPSRYRERLLEVCGGSMVVTITPLELNVPRSLMVYPTPRWREIEEKLDAMPSLNKVAQDLRRQLIGRAVDCDMDSHGRILIPPVLREWAGLSKPIRMIGQVKKFELWDEENWLAHTAALDTPISEELINQSNVLQELVL